MKDCKVHPISELPVYVVETSSPLRMLLGSTSNIFKQSAILNDNDAFDENISPSFEHVSIAQNNKRNILVGNLGEEIAQAFLSTRYPRVKRIAIEKSSEGYDIVANSLLCFEVKTSTSKNCEFEITINELRVANEKKCDYHIFYVAIDTNKRTAVGFIFDNPIEKFGVDLDNLTRQISVFEPTKFRGKVQEHMHLAKKVELTEFLIKILNKKPEYVEKLFTKTNEFLDVIQAD